MEGKYLITTDNFFIAPDGNQYRAVWGEVKPFTAIEVLGIEPNRNSANWMLRVGTDKDHVILAGCQIHYALTCPERPYTGKTTQVFGHSDTTKEIDGQIYIPGDTKAIIEIMRLYASVTELGNYEFKKTLLEVISALEFNPGFRLELLMRDIESDVIESYEIIGRGLGNQKILNLHFKDSNRYKAEIPCRIKQV